MGRHTRNQNDPENGCLSFGSEFVPSGQSRKMSIGIFADEHVRMRSGATKEDEIAATNTKKGASGHKLVGENNNQSEKVASMQERQVEDPGQKTSPWVTTRSSDMKTPAARTVQLYAKRTSVVNTGDGAQKKFNRINETPKSKIVQLYAKQSLFLQSSNGLQKKIGGVAYGMSKKKEGNSEKVEEFAFAAAQEVHVSDNGGREEKKDTRLNQKSDSLKQKLWEALETAPSQNEKPSDSKGCDNESENLDLDKQSNDKRSRAMKCRQNSDTIETGSESPNIEPGRPVTRSLTRKKASTVPHPNLKDTVSSGRNLPTNLSYRWGDQKENIFTFNEAEDNSRGLHQTSTSSLKLKSEKKNGNIEPRRISFSGEKKTGKVRQGTNKGKRPLAANRTTSHSSRVEKSCSNPSENKRDYLNSNNGVRKEELCYSPESKKASQHEEFSSPELQKTASPQDDLSSGSLKKKNAEAQYSVASPTIVMNRTIKNSFPNSLSPISIQRDQGIQNPAPDERESTERTFYNLRTRQKLRQGSPSGFKADSDSSDNTDGCKESPIRESSPVMEEVDATYNPSPSLEDREEESPEEDQHINQGCGGTGTAGSDNPEKSPIIISPRKRLHSEGINTIIPSSKRSRRDGPSSTSPSQKGAEELNELLQLSSQSQDGLVRAVALLVLGLERLKTRINTQTSRKSSEILTSLTDEIQLQLQNVNSQIQRDVLRFTSLSKSKRKSLETRFQEQHERLKSMQCKFKEEVAQHLHECKNMLEDLEAFQLELKGDAKRQKALHQKLFLQVEEAIGARLTDADRRITDIHKVAKDNMSQLRNVVRECLTEGVFN